MDYDLDTVARLIDSANARTHDRRVRRKASRAKRVAAAARAAKAGEEHEHALELGRLSCPTCTPGLDTVL